MTATEAARTKAWIEQHSKDHVMKYTGAIGGRYSYTFCPTSIGVLINIECGGCGAKESVDDECNPDPESFGGKLKARVKAAKEKKDPDAQS